MSSLLTDKELKLPVLEQSELRGSGRYFTGQSAIDEVEERIGRELTAVEKHLVKEEGFVIGPYKDGKGIKTYGVGQLEDKKSYSFDELISHYENRVRKHIPSYDDQPANVKIALMSADYRGDLGKSPTFVKLFNAGDYAAAAQEFLDHREYKRRLQGGTFTNKDGSTVTYAKGEDGVTNRLEEIADEVFSLANYERESGTAQLNKGLLESYTEKGALPDETEAPYTLSDYAVRRGDTLTSIANTLGIDLEDLRHFNEAIQGTDHIVPEQILRAPGNRGDRFLDEPSLAPFEDDQEDLVPQGA